MQEPDNSEARERLRFYGKTRSAIVGACGGAIDAMRENSVITTSLCYLLVNGLGFWSGASNENEFRMAYTGISIAANLGRMANGIMNAMGKEIPESLKVKNSERAFIFSAALSVIASFFDERGGWRPFETVRGLTNIGIHYINLLGVKDHDTDNLPRLYGHIKKAADKMNTNFTGLGSNVGVARSTLPLLDGIASGDVQMAFSGMVSMIGSFWNRYLQEYHERVERKGQAR